jgi:hypothetical protein
MALISQKSKQWVLASAALLSLHLGMARAEDNVLNEAEKKEGYRLLFNGTLASFKAEWVDYVKNNATNTNLDAKWVLDAANKCISLPSGSTTDIRSVKSYKDFELRMTYRIDGNQGIIYRGLLTYDFLWQTGVEFAINNVTNLGKDNPGAAYDIFAPPEPVPYNVSESGKLNSAKWNTARVIVIGDSVEHWSNGIRVVAYKYHSPSFWTAYNLSKWAKQDNKALTNVVAGRQDVNSGSIPEGYLGLQGDHGGRWQIKDLKLTTTPCFGPIKADSSVCASTSLSGVSAKSKQENLKVVRHGGSRFTVTFEDASVRNAVILSLNGKVMRRATILENGKKGEFSGDLKPGLYFLKVEGASGWFTQKVNLI